MSPRPSSAILRAGPWLALFLGCAPASAPVPRNPVVLTVVTAITADGRATEDWLNILRTRLSPERFDSAAPLIRVITGDESAWDTLIRSRTSDWETEAEALAALYTPAPPPDRVRIVLGNRGSEDAFTADPRTIGFDLSSLVTIYGSAHDPANVDRINHFFRHEFSHILQKAWLARHPWVIATPMDYALFDVWAEGLGNYYSLSERWVSTSGQLTEMGGSTLKELEPRFVERFSGLACADSVAGRPLLAGLSSGSFARKWGAVSAALWLATEPAPRDSAIRRLIRAGPVGVWDLADRHLTDSLRSKLREARATTMHCEPAGSR